MVKTMLLQSLFGVKVIKTYLPFVFKVEVVKADTSLKIHC